MEKVTWKHVSWEDEKMQGQGARECSSFGIGVQAVTTYARLNW